MFRHIRHSWIGLLLIVLAGCAAKPLEFDLDVKVSMDGRPVKGAVVVVDNVTEGATDAAGRFTKMLSKVPEKPIALAVRYEAGKLKAKEWTQTLTTKKRKEGEAREKLEVAAELMRYVVIAVAYEGKPESGAEVLVDDKLVGSTNEKGEIEYVFKAWPKGGLPLTVKKPDFGVTSFRASGESGDRISAELYKQGVVTIEAVTERGRQSAPVKGASVSLAGKPLGVTDERGLYTYHHKGTFGETGQFRIAAPGYLPLAVTRSAVLGGTHKIQQYFYSATARPIRTGVLNIVANTAGEDISDVVKKIEKSFVEELFDGKTFKQVPTDSVKNLIRRSKLSLDKIRTSGWRGTSLANGVDVLVFGSVSRGEGDSYVIETNFINADGKQVMSQAAIAGSGGSWRVDRATKEIVSNVMAAYPIEGTVTEVGDDGAKINLGRSQFTIGSDDQFTLYAARRDENGRIQGYSDAGTLKVRKRTGDYTVLTADGARVQARSGDRVVRVDTSRTTGTDRIAVVVKGGVGKDATPLAGVNVYIDQKWAGTTDRRGEVSVPLRLKKRYKMILYRHGYEQLTRNIEAEKAGARYEYVLKSYNSLLTMESEPSGASVYLDDNKIGTTPITKPYAVNLGFHTVRVELGADYRAWEEVVEFSKQNENRTGANKVVLHKDYLKLGEQAESSGNVDAAIKAYSSATRDHPDYAEMHNRLGQLYFDDKHDYDRAIAEFERVQAIPEVQELTLKQFAVVYTNLGKAYYAKGEAVYRSSRTDAAQYFAKAIKALDRAKENIRFFPNETYDEAVHDTYYYRALSYHYLYTATKKDSLLTSADLAWQEYFDFFPAKLQGRPEYVQMKESAEKLWKQIQDKL